MESDNSSKQPLKNKNIYLSDTITNIASQAKISSTVVKYIVEAELKVMQKVNSSKIYSTQYQLKAKIGSLKYSNKQLGHRKCQTIKYKRVTVINNKGINLASIEYKDPDCSDKN